MLEYMANLSKDELGKELDDWCYAYEAQYGYKPHTIVVPNRVYFVDPSAFEKRFEYVRVVGALYSKESDNMKNETVLRRMIRSYGMTVESFAIFCGIKRSRMFRIVNGSAIPNICDAMTIAKNLNCNIDDLWNEEGALI